MTLPSLFDDDAVYVPSSILDIEDARARRDAAIDQVDRNASADWKSSAYQAIVAVARSRDEFTTDDVWDVLHRMSIDAPHEPRALGSVMRRAATDGIIEATNRIEQSARAVCHAAPKRVWRSRLGIGHGATDQ